MLNPDFRDMLSALCEEEAEFLVVGAYALAAHGLPRATGDLDIWVRPTEENGERVLKALVRFGAPLHDLRIEDLRTSEVVYQIGVPPRRIDILTSIDGVPFDEAWPRRLDLEIEGLRFPVLGREEMIRNKRASGRPQDLADVERLEAG
ncbi:MAG: hypothetical protein ABIK65_10670 [Candidatus Eisenbacteria bacterium]